MTNPSDYRDLSVGELIALYAVETAEQIAADPQRAPAKRQRATRDAETLRRALNTDPIYDLSRK